MLLRCSHIKWYYIYGIHSKTAIIIITSSLPLSSSSTLSPGFVFQQCCISSRTRTVDRTVLKVGARPGVCWEEPGFPKGGGGVTPGTGQWLFAERLMAIKRFYIHHHHHILYNHCYHSSITIKTSIILPPHSPSLHHEVKIQILNSQLNICRDNLRQTTQQLDISTSNEADLRRELRMHREWLDALNVQLLEKEKQVMLMLLVWCHWCWCWCRCWCTNMYQHVVVVIVFILRSLFFLLFQCLSYNLTVSFTAETPGTGQGVGPAPLREGWSEPGNEWRQCCWCEVHQAGNRIGPDGLS